MDALLALLATVPAIAATFLVARWCARRQRAYFAAVVSTRGNASRQPSPVKFGLGLDEVSVGTWDFFPALRALWAKEPDPDLDGLRRSARAATVSYLVQWPASLIEALAVALLLRVMPLVPVVAAFLAWALLQSVAFRYALAYSRPEIEELRTGWGSGIGVVASVVGMLLAVSFGLVAVGLLVRG